VTQRRSDMSTEESAPRSGRVIDQRSTKPSSPAQLASWSVLLSVTVISPRTASRSRATTSAGAGPAGGPATISLRSCTWKGDEPSTQAPARRNHRTCTSSSSVCRNGFQSSGTDRPGIDRARVAMACTAVCTRHSASTSTGTSFGFTFASGRR
jgi:hypothetical protein